MKFFRGLKDYLNVNSELRSRILLIIGVIGVLALAIFLSGPINDDNNVAILTPTPVPASAITNPVTISAPTEDPFADYANTTGVTVGVVGVVVILLFGTFIELLSDQKEKKG